MGTRRPDTLTKVLALVARFWLLMLPSPPPTTSTTTVLRQPVVSAAISRTASARASSIIKPTGASTLFMSSLPAGMSPPAVAKSFASTARTLALAPTASGATSLPDVPTVLLLCETVGRVIDHLPVPNSLGVCCDREVTLTGPSLPYAGPAGIAGLACRILIKPKRALALLSLIAWMSPRRAINNRVRS